MKKQALMIVATVGFLIVLSAAPAFAQGMPSLRAQVPFEFSISNKAMPAGKYEIVKGSVNGTVVVRAADHKTVAGSLGTPIGNKREAAATQLLFHRYGNQYFLARIEIEGWGNAIELPKTKSERQAAKLTQERHLAKNNAEPEIISVPASF